MTERRHLSNAHSDPVPFASGICLVEVGVTDNLLKGVAPTQLWIAALPEGEAVAAVKKFVPENWTALLRADRLPAESVTRLKLRPGEVRELMATK